MAQSPLLILNPRSEDHYGRNDEGEAPTVSSLHQVTFKKQYHRDGCHHQKLKRWQGGESCHMPFNLPVWSTHKANGFGEWLWLS